MQAQSLRQSLSVATKAGCSVLLYGPPGRGKSMAALQAALDYCSVHPGSIYRQLSLPEDTPTAIIAGGFRPTSDGTWIWTDGPATAVARVGGVLILDELANASPEATTFLHAILDGTPELTLPSGEVLRKQPITVIATQNDEPDSLRSALLDRLPVRLEITTPEDYTWLGKISEAAKRDLENNPAASLRPWAALRRALDRDVDASSILPLLWPGRATEMLDALKLSEIL